MEILAIRLPVNKIDFLYRDLSFDSYNYAKLILDLKNQLYIENEQISSILFEEVKKAQSDKDRRDLINFRRKIYKSFKDYANDLDKIKRRFSKNILKRLESHNFLRIRYSELNRLILKEIEKETEQIENIIKLQLVSNWFSNALLVVNQNLFNSIYDSSQTLDKNKYTTLLRYLHKSSIMPTPSSLWAGIVTGYFGDKDNFEIDSSNFNITLEFNCNIAKHLAKREFKKNINPYKPSLYINPTACIIENNIYFWSSSYNVLKKCKLPYKYFMKDLFLQKDRIFSICDLESILIHHIEYETLREQIYYLIETDFLKVLGTTYYADENPLKTIGSVLKNPILAEIPERIYTNSFEGFKEDFLKLSSITEIYPTQLVRANLAYKQESITLHRKIKNEFNKAMSIYIKLFELLYPYTSENNIVKYIKDSYGENRSIPLLELSFLPYSKTLDYKTYNYRSWRETSQNKQNYKTFIDIIKKKLNSENKVLKLTINDFEVVFPKESYGIDKLECIFQFYEEDNSKIYIIPEMLSIHVGRLLGRFLRYFNAKERELFEKLIYNCLPNAKNVVQGNIHINNDLDGIGFSIPSITKQLYIYDRNVKSKQEISISDVYLKLQYGTLITHLKNNEEIFIWNASSISPGNERIYKLLNYISLQNNLNLNGHAYSRIELDLDYQPRICIDNLVISRERFRLRLRDFDFLNSKSPLSKKLIEIFNLFIKLNLPMEFFVYTDINFKATYINLKTIYDLLIFQRAIKNTNNFIYIEELLPQKKHYKNKTNLEVWAKYEK
ncbi:lantibiotic dehydratase [Lysinibacillus sp. NPDC093210]|uniref:lantibiotic dehydratase n=1 Tax=Lysinibacillus sp. NPDC093210 TaxID=3364133 RepID=UPI003815C5EB